MKLFKIGDKVRNKRDHTYKGTVTKTKYVGRKGLSFGDFQFLWLDGSEIPCGSTSENWELDILTAAKKLKHCQFCNKHTEHEIDPEGILLDSCIECGELSDRLFY